MTAKATVSIDVQRLEVMVRWAPVLFPFEQWKLLSVLPQEGYVVSPEVQSPLPFGSRMEMTGIAGRKGDLYVGLDRERPGLSVGGTLALDVVAEFEHMEQVILETARFESRKFARFYELDAQVIVWTDKSPLESITERMANAEFITEIAEAFKYPLAGRGFRLSMPGVAPHEEEWHEILLEASIRSPRDAYFGLVVFRRKGWPPVKDFALRTEDLFAAVCGKM